MHSYLISIDFSLEAKVLLACFVSKEATVFGQNLVLFFFFSTPGKAVQRAKAEKLLLKGLSLGVWFDPLSTIIKGL